MAGPARRPPESSAQRARLGVLLFAMLAVLAVGGWLLVFHSATKIPVRRGAIDGLELHLEQARWILDQMDHGENFSKPSTMMPGMPEWGMQRVTLQLAFHNQADGPRRYDGSEFWLEPEIGEAVPPSGAQLGYARIEPGQSLNTAVHFDFDTEQPHGRLRVAWRRDGEVVYLPVPEPAEHYHLRPRGGELAMPPDARLVLPLGDVERGETLFMGKYGCAACHGDPALAGTNNVGPHLAAVAARAVDRVDGQSAAQYLYESILDPNAFIAPECKNAPCTEPTAMPEYASLMTLEDVAHLLVYLMDQTESL
ncbi:MAG: hypothetical protein AAGC60_17040 [Acidobacteriota bacterium]